MRPFLTFIIVASCTFLGRADDEAAFLREQLAAGFERVGLLWRGMLRFAQHDGLISTRRHAERRIEGSRDASLSEEPRYPPAFSFAAAAAFAALRSSSSLMLRGTADGGGAPTAPVFFMISHCWPIESTLFQAQ